MKKLLPLCAILLSASFSVAASDGLLKYQVITQWKDGRPFEEIAKAKV